MDGCVISTVSNPINPKPYLPCNARIHRHSNTHRPTIPKHTQILASRLTMADAATKEDSAGAAAPQAAPEKTATTFPPEVFTNRRHMTACPP